MFYMKKGRLFVATFILIASLAVTQITNASEISEPTFADCENPQGQLKVSYASGIHGIVGVYSEQTGSDAVYTLTQDTLVQCFCPNEGNGTQTNWWKVSEMSLEEVAELQKQGWTYIPNGALWGLEEEPYLAKNLSYDCHDNNNDDDEDEDDDNDGGRGGLGGDILATGYSTTRLGIGGQVLGLANTGDTPAIIGFGITAATTFGTSVYINRPSKNKKKD